MSEFSSESLGWLLKPSFPALGVSEWMKTLVLFTYCCCWFWFQFSEASVTDSKLPVPLSQPLLGWLVKLAKISGCEHCVWVCAYVCLVAPRAHANWGPKGKAFIRDLSQLHSFNCKKRVELKGSACKPFCMYATEAASSTDNRSNCYNYEKWMIPIRLIPQDSQALKGTFRPERGLLRSTDLWG